jgi:hypothetical protein
MPVEGETLPDREGAREGVGVVLPNADGGAGGYREPSIGLGAWMAPKESGEGDEWGIGEGE